MFCHTFFRPSTHTQQRVRKYKKREYEYHFWIPKMGFVYTLLILWSFTPTAMQNILTLLLLLASIAAASMVGLNVAQMTHAQSKGTCVVGSNSAGNPTSNSKSGNPHCFDPEQQPAGSSAQPPSTATGTGACAAGTSPGGCNHPQSTNPQGKVTGNSHEEPSSGCQGVASCHTNPQGSLVGNPHYPTR